MLSCLENGKLTGWFRIMSKFCFEVVSELSAKKLKHDNGNKKHIGKRSTVQNLRQKSPNNWVNLTAGSSVALIASKFSGRRRLPLALAV